VFQTEFFWKKQSLRKQLPGGKNTGGTDVTEASMLGEKKDFCERSILSSFRDAG